MDDKIRRLLEAAETDQDHSSVSFAERIFSARRETERAFDQLKIALQNIEVWNEAAALNAFKLFDADGNEQPSPMLAENVFSRMTLKGSGKYDWVKIIRIDDRENALIITVKPAFDPTDKDAGKAQTSHFFTAESTNNFCLQKEFGKVGFYVIGLDETPNVSEAKNTLEIIRNATTANIGAYLGIQKAEWDNFCSNFLALYQPKPVSSGSR